MILSRVMEHVKAQHWTAVFLDFVVVVLGVFIGIQVSNLNESRHETNLERSYLMRLASDMEATGAKFQADIEKDALSRDVAAAMIRTAADPTTSDESLIASIDRFFSDGWQTPVFRPVDNAYQDLTSTGNLQLIRNTTLRDSIIALYNRYDDAAAVFQLNAQWLSPNDSRLYYEHNILLFSPRFSGIVYKNKTSDKAAAYRTAQADVGRIAEGYYWTFTSALRELHETTERTNDVLKMIRRELKTVP
jgi:hypothetical protein